jgi:hypothetical protein
MLLTVNIQTSEVPAVKISDMYLIVAT